MPAEVSGMAIAFLFVPLNALAFGVLEKEQLGNASGIFNLMRNVGGSVGISTITTLLVRRGQVHQSMMVAHLNPSSLSYVSRLGAITKYLEIHQTGAPADALQKSFHLLYGLLLKQSALWAFVDIFEWKLLVCGICILFVFALKNVKPSGRVPAH